MSAAFEPQDGQTWRPTWAEIDLEAVRQNARTLVRLARAKGMDLIAVVKADGYGHGAAECSRAALEEGAKGVAVATAEEGARLRRAGIRGQVLVMGAYVPGTFAAFVEHELDVTVTSAEQAEALASESRALLGSVPARQVAAHVKIDTGMCRLGVAPEEASALAGVVAGEPGLRLKGVYTHLATADEEDPAFTTRQLKQFDGALSVLRENGFEPEQVHALNSAGLLQHDPGRTNACRVGIALYGLAPSRFLAGRAPLVPALAFKTRVVAVKRVSEGATVSYGRMYRVERPTQLAALPVGYADGFSRRLTGRAFVLIRGKRYPVVGAICMDQAIVDVGDDPVAPGDVAVLLGRMGDERITADDWAQALGTINYEVVCGISSRVPRVYLNGG